MLVRKTPQSSRLRTPGNENIAPGSRQTPARIPRRTPKKTPAKTPEKTPTRRPVNRFGHTPGKTPVKTPLRAQRAAAMQMRAASKAAADAPAPKTRAHTPVKAPDIEPRFVCTDASAWCRTNALLSVHIHEFSHVHAHTNTRHSPGRIGPRSFESTAPRTSRRG